MTRQPSQLRIRSAADAARRDAGPGSGSGGGTAQGSTPPLDVTTDIQGVLKHRGANGRRTFGVVAFGVLLGLGIAFIAGVFRTTFGAAAAVAASGRNTHPLSLDTFVFPMSAADGVAVLVGLLVLISTVNITVAVTPESDHVSRDPFQADWRQSLTAVARFAAVVGVTLSALLWTNPAARAQWGSTAAVSVLAVFCAALSTTLNPWVGDVTVARDKLIFAANGSRAMVGAGRVKKRKAKQFCWPRTGPPLISVVVTVAGRAAIPAAIEGVFSPPALHSVTLGLNVLLGSLLYSAGRLGVLWSPGMGDPALKTISVMVTVLGISLQFRDVPSVLPRDLPGPSPRVGDWRDPGTTGGLRLGGKYQQIRDCVAAHPRGFAGEGGEATGGCRRRPTSRYTRYVGARRHQG